MAKNRKISNNMVNLMNVINSPNSKNTTDTKFFAISARDKIDRE